MTSMKVLAATAVALLGTAHADDPSGSWLSYAAYTDPADRRITSLTTTWKVPSNPAQSFGSNAPGWWFGVQTKAGDGALVQPILAYDYQTSAYTIFNACFDWTDGSWTPSDDYVSVLPGAVITSSVKYVAKDNSYDMYIASGGKSVSTNYKLLAAQHKNESTAYFVLEHQPRTCKAYPTNGNCTFYDIELEVDGQPVKDVPWQAKQEQPACDSKATVVDSHTINFSWNPNAKSAPRKWGYGD